MGKSLISESVIEKLDKLDRNISYKIGDDQIDITVEGVNKKQEHEYDGEKSSHFTVSRNGKKVFEKRHGWSGGGWSNWNTEDFYLNNSGRIYNNVLATDEDYIYTNGSFSVQGNEIYRSGGFDNYKILDDIFVEKFKASCGVYFIPSTKEIGIRIGDVNKVIESPYDNTSEKVKKIFDDYNATSKDIKDSILDKINSGVSNQIILPISEHKYNELKKFLDDILVLSIDEKRIFDIVKSVKNVEKIYSLYQDMTQYKEVIEVQISELNSLLEQCLDKALADKEAYENELKETQLALKKKYNIIDNKNNS